MDLDKLEIVLRPRSPWEAIDLGFALARRWFVPLGMLWLMSALPLSILMLIITDGNLIWMSLLIWWCKPIYEPPLMFWLSRAVFGERPEMKEVRRKWLRIVWPQLFANLTWRRLSSNRSFYMPVALLEGLKGNERQRRTSILGRRQHAGTWLTIVGIHLEGILELCFLLTIYFLVPEELRWFDSDSMILSPGPIDEWLQLICWLAAMGIIAPFYVAGGFALYLHRRSELEGWDIEINFRRTAEKIASSRRTSLGALLASFFCVLLFAGQPNPAYAGPGPVESKEQVEEILADPLFGRMEEQSYWEYVGDEEDEATEEEEEESSEGFFKALESAFEAMGGFMKGIADVGEIILWGLGLLIVAFILYHISRNRDWMKSLPAGKTKARRQLPSELFGLDVRPDSLPDDIAGEALQLARKGELRNALSLLYRGTLIRLIAEHQLDIPASATEGECLNLVQRYREQGEADYFRQLTQAWLTTAYAHLKPDARRIEQLCHDWQEVYGHAER